MTNLSNSLSIKSVHGAAIVDDAIAVFFEPFDDPMLTNILLKSFDMFGI